MAHPTNVSTEVSTEYAALKAAARGGQLSRRELVRRGLALGLAAPALAGLLTSYRGAEALAQPVAPAGPEAVRGKTYDIAILGIEGWPPSQLGADLATELFKPYALETLGYTVNFTFEGSPFDQLFQRAANSLSTGSAEYNIIISDSQWLGALSAPGWIVQLNDIIAANPELDIEFEEIPQQGYRVYPDGSDQLWGFPQEGDTIAMFVRQDLFSDQAERDAFKAANGGADLPQTFEDWEALDIDQFEAIAAFFTRPDQNLWGTSMQWSVVYDYISCYLYPFMFSTGGEIIRGTAADGTYQVEGVLDSEINAAAMVRNKDFLQYAPEGATNHGIAELVDVFTSGVIATCFQWSALGPQMLNVAGDASRPITPEMVQINVPPGFRAADGTLNRIYALGGQPWVINAYNNAEQMQIAVDFMKWWYTEETQAVFAERGGNPSVKATLDAPGFEELQPHFRSYKYMIQNGHSRDFWHDPNYAEMLAVQQEAFSAFLTDIVTDPMAALKYTAVQQQGILFDAGQTDIEPSVDPGSVTLG